MTLHLPCGTLVYITGGLYTGYVGWVDTYTARRVQLYPIEDSQHSRLDDAEPILTAPGKIIRLTTSSALSRVVRTLSYAAGCYQPHNGLRY
jgi:hypothetical protein